MPKPSRTQPRPPLCLIIAGPNGAGKTTFAREFLPREAGLVHFANVDLIAAGLSPLKPELASLAAGRLLLHELDRLAAARIDFAFESTLSGLTYASRLRSWKSAGYRIEVVFLQLASVRLALRRIADRVRQGGHPVPAADVRRRFHRGWHNFLTPTGRWRTRGPFTTTPLKNADSSRKDHDVQDQTQEFPGQGSRPRIAPRRKTGANRGPTLRHAHPRSIERHRRRAETVTRPRSRIQPPSKPKHRQAHNPKTPLQSWALQNANSLQINVLNRWFPAGSASYLVRFLNPGRIRVHPVPESVIRCRKPNNCQTSRRKSPDELSVGPAVDVAPVEPTIQPLLQILESVLPRRSKASRPTSLGPARRPR